MSVNAALNKACAHPPSPPCPDPPGRRIHFTAVWSLNMRPSGGPAANVTAAGRGFSH